MFDNLSEYVQIKSDLGRNLFILRKALGYNHFDLVKLTGLTRPILSNIENSVGNPTFDSLLKISNSLKTDINFLLISQYKYESLQTILKDNFLQQHKDEDKFIISDKTWRKLLDLSGSEQKNEQGKIAMLCKEVIDQNINDWSNINRSNIILLASLGVIFQKDGFQFGLEFGAWLGKNL